MTKLCNRIITVNSRRTSMRLCSQEWKALDEVCRKEKLSRSELVTIIEKNKNEIFGLAYATRLFLLLYYKAIAERQRRQVLATTLKDLS